MLAPNVKVAPPPGAVVAPPEPNMLGCDVLPNSDLATPLPTLAADTAVFWPNMEPDELTLLRTGTLLAPNIGAELAGGAPNWKVLLVAALPIARGGADVLLVPLIMGAEKPNGLADDVARSFLGAPKLIFGADVAPSLNMSAPPLTKGCESDATEGVVVFDSVCGPPAADGVAALNSACDPRLDGGMAV